MLPDVIAVVPSQMETADSKNWISLANNVPPRDVAKNLGISHSHALSLDPSLNLSLVCFIFHFLG